MTIVRSTVFVFSFYCQVTSELPPRKFSWHLMSALTCFYV